MLSSRASLCLALAGCRKDPAPPVAPPTPAKPRFQLSDSKAELTYDATKKRAKIEVTTGPSATVVLEGASGKLDEATTDGTGKTTLTLTGGQLPPGKNHFTLKLSNPFGQEHSVPLDVEVGEPTRFVLHPKEADEKVAADQLATTYCIGVLDDVEFSTEGSGRQLKTVRSLAFDADLPGVTALEVNGKAVPVKEGKASFAFDPLAFLAQLSGSDAVDVEGASFSVQVKVTLSGKELTGAITCKTMLAAAFLSGAASGKALLPGEDAKRAGHKVLVAPERGKIWGTAATLADVDLVQLATSHDTVLGTCDYTSADGARSSGQRLRSDIVANVYDRRTGKKLGTKTFEGVEPICKPKVEGDESRSALGAEVWGSVDTWAFGVLDAAD